MFALFLRGKLLTTHGTVQHSKGSCQIDGEEATYRFEWSKIRLKGHEKVFEIVFLTEVSTCVLLHNFLSQGPPPGCSLFMKLSESIQMLGSPYFGFIDKFQFLDLMINEAGWALKRRALCLFLQTNC